MAAPAVLRCHLKENFRHSRKFYKFKRHDSNEPTSSRIPHRDQQRPIPVRSRFRIRMDGSNKRYPPKREESIFLPRKSEDRAAKIIIEQIVQYIDDSKFERLSLSNVRLNDPPKDLRVRPGRWHWPCAYSPRGSSTDRHTNLKATVERGSFANDRQSYVQVNPNSRKRTNHRIRNSCR